MLLWTKNWIIKQLTPISRISSNICASLVLVPAVCVVDEAGKNIFTLLLFWYFLGYHIFVWFNLFGSIKSLASDIDAFLKFCHTMQFLYIVGSKLDVTSKTKKTSLPPHRYVHLIHFVHLFTSQNSEGEPDQIYMNLGLPACWWVCLLHFLVLQPRAYLGSASCSKKVPWLVI